MCVSMNESEMTRTIVYAAPAMLGGKVVHVLGYQNQARSEGPNAMVLPFPTAAKMGPNNMVDMVDMTECPGLLTDLRAITAPTSRGGAKGISGSRGLVQTFAVGSYHVVLAEDARDIAGALKRVPAEKRPTAKPGFFEAYYDLYPGQPVAVCCWAGSVAPEPLLWWFEPSDPDTLFFPGVDAHDGEPPRRGASVETDHHLVWGTLVEGTRGARYDASRLPEHVRPFVAPRLFGAAESGIARNGDWWLPIDRVGLHTPSRVAI